MRGDLFLTWGLQSTRVGVGTVCVLEEEVEQQQQQQQQQQVFQCEGATPGTWPVGSET